MEYASSDIQSPSLVPYTIILRLRLNVLSALELAVPEGSALGGVRSSAFGLEVMLLERLRSSATLAIRSLRVLAAELGRESGGLPTGGREVEDRRGGLSAEVGFAEDEDG